MEPGATEAAIVRLAQYVTVEPGATDAAIVSFVLSFMIVCTSTAEHTSSLDCKVILQGSSALL